MNPSRLLATLSVGGAALLAGAAPTATAQELPAPKQSRSSGFDMLRSSSVWHISGNRVGCRIWNAGELCEYHQGGWWPLPSRNSYIYGSGLQVAGIVAADGGPWARDTVGAFYYDVRGTQPHGDAVTEVFSSANTYDNDLEHWPTGAIVRDPDVFHPALLGRQFLSSEDAWFRTQDGPDQLGGRDHPMGVLVEHRSLQFNYPVGNEDILYWVFTLYNISASDPGAYAGLDPAIQAEIAAIGAEWVSRTESRLDVDLPASGYRIDSLYVGLAMDPDVGINYRTNNSSAVLPFDASLAYMPIFTEPSWSYLPEYITPPFGPHPGFVGAAVLRTPPAQGTGRPPGLSVFSNTTGSARFPDPVGVSQLWRYLSMNLSQPEGDAPCDINPPKERRLCALVQVPSDTRFFQSTGPFSLGPGESVTVVMAYVFAGPIAAAIEPVGTYVSPGIPPAGADLVAGTDTLRQLDRAAGWVSHSDQDGDGDLSPEEVETVPRSFLHKVQLARDLVARRFLLPSAPAEPSFYLVPGDDRVTIAWEPSTTEQAGDPYSADAADPASGLYDPNFRRHDVEGYRLYRGRSPDQLELIAQYDYAGTVFTDYTGAWPLPYRSQCAPELGVTDDCPEFADYPNPATDPIEHELAGEAVQVLPGGRFLIEGLVTVTRADTVPQAQYPRLRDTGVPFIHVDSTVQNSYPYYYAVTAFDINSRASGPASLESPLVVKSIVPRRDAANLTEAALEMGLYGRGQALDQRATFTFDATTGTFSGAPPPTKLLSVAAAELFLPTLVLAGARIELRVDSVVPSYYEGDYYLTLDQNGQTTSLHYTGLPVTSHDHYWPRLFDPIEVPIPTDPALADTTGQPGVPYAGRAAFAFGVRAVTPYSGDAEWHEDVDGAFWYSDRLTGLGPSRWFSGDDESTPYGGYYWRGALDGVNVIHSPQPNYSGGLPDGPLTAPVYALFRRLRQATWAVARQADVKFYWGHLPGTLDSVVDVTHNVRVPFISSGQYGVGWGFRDDIAGRSTTYAPPDGVVTEYDFAFGPCFPEGLPSHTVGACATRPFVDTAVLQPVDIDGDGAADGDGFALYFNHEFYLFQTDALPANTVWTHRSHFGVTAGTPGDYTFTPWDANPVVPGLTARLEVLAAATTRAVTTDDLAHVHTVPDPFYGSSALQPSPSDRVITFVNLPERAIIRIYSVSGVLVDVIEHYDPALGGEATWDARNRNGRVVASGVYFYHVETPDGAETIGRMSVIIGSNLGVPE